MERTMVDKHKKRLTNMLFGNFFDVNPPLPARQQFREKNY